MISVKGLASLRKLFDQFMSRNTHHPADLDELSNVQPALTFFVFRHERLWAMHLFGHIALRHASFKARLFETS